MRVLVCGSRNWHRDDIVRERLARLPRGTTVMHGGARGADQMAGRAARSLGFHEEVYPANWQSGGKHRKGYNPRAGIERNLTMLDTRPDLVIAFHRDNSTGTQHVIDEALKRGIPLDVIAA